MNDAKSVLIDGEMGEIMDFEKRLVKKQMYNRNSDSA